MSKVISNAPFVRSPYNYDTMAASDESAIFCSDPSLAVQSSRDECDINIIVAKYLRSGELPGNVRSPQYGDFTGFSDYHSSLNTVIAADEAFSALPALIRARFDNDPANLIAAVGDPAQQDLLVELGLATRSSAMEKASADALLGQEAGGASSGRPSSARSKPSVSASNEVVGGDNGGG